MLTKIVKWGNSLGLRIPKSFAEEVQVAEGSTVDLKMENGQLIVRAVQSPRPTLEELLEAVTADNIGYIRISQNSESPVTLMNAGASTAPTVYGNDAGSAQGYPRLRL